MHTEAAVDLAKLAGLEAAGTKAGNKGYDAALSAIEMANLLKNF